MKTIVISGSEVGLCLLPEKEREMYIVSFLALEGVHSSKDLFVELTKNL